MTTKEKITATAFGTHAVTMLLSWLFLLLGWGIPAVVVITAGVVIIWVCVYKITRIKS